MTSERLLLGPGPSPVSARVMRAMSAPVLSHLDPEMMAILDDLRAPPRRGRSAPATGAFSLAISGTGTRGWKRRSPTSRRPATRVLVVVTGYFGDRLAQMFAALRRDGDARRRRVGPRLRPGRGRAGARRGAADIVAVVHAETSTGVLNPVQEIAAIAARARRADDRRRGDVARRDAARDRRRGASTSATAARRRDSARRPGWRRSRSRRARSRSKVHVAQLLPRSGAARGLLGPPQVSPHDFGAARLRAARSARRGRGGRARGALGASRAQPPRARRRARGARPRRSCRRPASGSGR